MNRLKVSQLDENFDGVSSATQIHKLNEFIKKQQLRLNKDLINTKKQQSVAYRPSVNKEMDHGPINPEQTKAPKASKDSVAPPSSEPYDFGMMSESEMIEDALIDNKLEE